MSGALQDEDEDFLRRLHVKGSAAAALKLHLVDSQLGRSFFSFAQSFFLVGGFFFLAIRVEDTGAKRTVATSPSSWLCTGYDLAL